MTETTEGLYIPEPLLNGYRDMIQAEVPSDIVVGVSQTELTERAVNLWPTNPTIESWALAGALRARIRLQVTCIDTTVNGARMIGDRVRMLIAGRTARGALATRPDVDGFTVINVEAGEGRSDEQGGVGQWTEVFDILYDARSADIPQS